jgi:hypothetical protein
MMRARGKFGRLRHCGMRFGNLGSDAISRNLPPVGTCVIPSNIEKLNNPSNMLERALDEEENAANQRSK